MKSICNKRCNEMEILKLLYEFLLTGSILSKIRSLVVVLFLGLLGLKYLKIRKERKKISTQDDSYRIESIYKKNENGLYPWEVDEDDSPERISANAKRMNTNWGPERGRW